MIQKDDDHTLAPEEIITMNWLADNVIGSIPDFEMLADEARPVVRLQGLRKPKTEERFDENTDIGRPGITISVGLF